MSEIKGLAMKYASESLLGRENGEHKVRLAEICLDWIWGFS